MSNNWNNGKALAHKKLAIGFPHPGHVRTCFMMSLLQFRELDLRHDNMLEGVIPQQGLYIAGMRNQIVKDFLAGTKCPWLLMTDTDHLWEPQIPYLLVESAAEADARVMSALYFGMMASKVSPMWFQRIANGDYATVNEITHGIQEIAAFGCGMVLIHRSVFEEMAPRYQDDNWKWFNHDPVMFHGEIARYGEDIGFCERLRQMGIKMYGDSRIHVGHEKTFNLDIHLFMKLKAELKEGEGGDVLAPIV